VVIFAWEGGGDGGSLAPMPREGKKRGEMVGASGPVAKKGRDEGGGGLVEQSANAWSCWGGGPGGWQRPDVTEADIGPNEQWHFPSIKKNSNCPDLI
jgi:hypothetical protein